MAANYTPMLEQYRNLKMKHQEEILFFRLGDFYEMFFEDASLASQELGITLTSREGGKKSRVPMCGVPYHSAESYIAKLINKGYKVAICEQVENPKEVKGIVRREVIKIITPGTVLTETLLTEKESNFLVLLHEKENILSLAATDISTGEFIWSEYEGAGRVDTVCDELYHLMPAEIIISAKIGNFSKINAFVNQRIPNCVFTDLNLAPEEATLARQLPKTYFSQNEIPSGDASLAAVGFLLHYLQYALKRHLSHINRLTKYNAKNHLVLDASTLRNLEIIGNIRDGSTKGTLFGVLDFAKTAMGRRLLKKCLEYPLRDKIKITKRHDAVAEFLDKPAIRENLMELLQNIYDFERIMTRVEVGTANARDLLALKDSLSRLPAIKEALHGFKSDILFGMGKTLNVHENIVAMIEAAITENPPLSIRDGDIIKNGYNDELDLLRRLSKDSKNWVQDLEIKEREATGIKSLKVGYNKVFGYYIEVTHANTKSVPATYIRKQTLVNAERYITPELKNFEIKILGAQEKIIHIEHQLFMALRDNINEYLQSIQRTARQVAQLDVLTSLSQAAAQYNYVRPLLNDEGIVDIKDGRHPVVERFLSDELFVPNDTFLNNSDNQIMIITGPNMAGKSTYMRQTALLSVMAQAGSFVPAREASFPLLDRIFTRVGASDDLASGQSTFMVEMNEVAQIIKCATSESLIILDEIGRGTSTFDGMSIARSVVEYIKGHIGAKTLFATHYHELTDLAEYNREIKNYSVAVKERGNDVIFLRRIVPGGADKSYGIYVAQLAGLPAEIIQKARHILEELEKLKHPSGLHSQMPAQTSTTQISTAQTSTAQTSTAQTASLAGGRAKTPSAIVEELINLDVMTTMPLEALNILSRLQVKAKEEITGK